MASRIELEAPRELIGRVQVYAAERFGFRTWLVKPIDSEPDPEDGCTFSVLGTRYVALGDLVRTVPGGDGGDAE